MGDLPIATVHLEPFDFPNFLRVKEWADHTYPVAMLSEAEAAAYWDELRPRWLAHVRARHNEWQAEMENARKMQNLKRWIAS